MKDLILLIVVVALVSAAISAIIYYEYHYEPSFDIEPGETMVTITDIDMHQHQDSDTVSVELELLNTSEFELPYLLFAIEFKQDLMPLLFVDSQHTNLSSGDSIYLTLKDNLKHYNPDEQLDLQNIQIRYSEKDVPFDVDLE